MSRSYIAYNTADDTITDISNLEFIEVPDHWQIETTELGLENEPMTSVKNIIFDLNDEHFCIPFLRFDIRGN